ncbi:MAG TPA: hypothetical protein VJL07_02565 [Dehalococcoidia bacterium]|nr:hypothetical protein [Dehalococcoidia bacterium]
MKGQLRDAGLVLAVRQLGPKYWTVKTQAVQQAAEMSVIRVTHAMVYEPTADGGEGAAAFKEVAPLENGGASWIQANHY